MVPLPAFAAKLLEGASREVFKKVCLPVTTHPIVILIKSYEKSDDRVEMVTESEFKSGPNWTVFPSIVRMLTSCLPPINSFERHPHDQNVRLGTQDEPAHRREAGDRDELDILEQGLRAFDCDLPVSHSISMLFSSAKI